MKDQEFEIDLKVKLTARTPDLTTEEVKGALKAHIEKWIGYGLVDIEVVERNAEP